MVAGLGESEAGMGHVVIGAPILPISENGVVSVTRGTAFYFSLWNANYLEWRPVWNWNFRMCGPGCQEVEPAINGKRRPCR